MSATDELRRMLDERGVEWKDGDAAFEIEWSTPDGRHCSAMYWKPSLSVLISGCTPEQAIAATLGGGECEIAHRNGDWYCTGCDEMVGGDDPWNELFVNGNAIELWEYCPVCGRKVKR